MVSDGCGSASARGPLWVAPARLSRQALPAPARAWLLDDASLTSRLRAACQHFHVGLVECGNGRVLADEALWLGVASHRPEYVRQVQLYCDAQPSVFARTVIPHQTLRGRYRRLLALGARPLGEVLFSDRLISRGAMQVARLLPRHRLFQLAAAGLSHAPAALWARRSLFLLAGRPLLVSEVFLPVTLFTEYRHAR